MAVAASVAGVSANPLPGLVSAAFFEERGPGRYRATERTEGPWDPRLQHASPPCALLTRELERIDPRDDAFLSRISFDLLGPIPLGELEVSARVERPGRSVELMRAELRAGGRPVVRASAWRVQKAQTDGGPDGSGSIPPLAGAESVLPDAIARTGYLRSIEWRAAGDGDWNTPGAAAVWARPRVPLLEGEEMTGLQRMVAVCDSASGISAVLPWRSWLFINTDLTVHVVREPQGEWILIDAQTQISEGGAGITTSVLSDRSGWAARGAQTLLVRRS